MNRFCSGGIGGPDLCIEDGCGKAVADWIELGRHPIGLYGYCTEHAAEVRADLEAAELEAEREATEPEVEIDHQAEMVSIVRPSVGQLLRFRLRGTQA